MRSAVDAPYSQYETDWGMDMSNMFNTHEFGTGNSNIPMYGLCCALQSPSVTEDRRNIPQLRSPRPQPTRIQLQPQHQFHRQSAPRELQREFALQPMQDQRDSHQNAQQTNPPISRETRRDSRADRRRRRRNVRAATYCPEYADNADPPPPYSFYDPNSPMPVPYPESPRLEDRSQPAFTHAQPASPLPENWIRRTNQLQREDPTTINNQDSGEWAKALSRMNGHFRELPKTVKEVPAKWQTWRARQKIAWLTKHGFLSDQERFLASDLRG